MGKTGKLARKVVSRQLADLKPWNRNARTHSGKQVDQIAASVLSWTTPTLIDEEKRILTGHARANPATKMGGHRALYHARGQTDKQKKAYITADLTPPQSRDSNSRTGTIAGGWAAGGSLDSVDPALRPSQCGSRNCKT